MLSAALVAGGAALANGIIGGFNNRRANHAQSVENAKQREWQTAENEKTREYNRMLAHQQNQWNIEQWNRENAYNSPAAQMKRFAAAGLNPNAVLGNMSNGPQISGSLTAGAPATPTQGQFDSSVGHRMSSQFDRVKLDPFMMEQLRSMRLDNEAKEFELGFQEFIHQNQFDPLGIKNALKGNLTPAQRKYLQGIQNDINQGDSLVKDIEKKEIENALASETFDSLVDKLASEAKISKENADYLAKSAVYRLDAEKFQSELYELQKLYQANKNEWMDWDRWISHGINAAHAVGDIFALKNIFGLFSKKGVLESGGKGFWKKTGENTYEWNGK